MTLRLDHPLTLWSRYGRRYSPTETPRSAPPDSQPHCSSDPVTTGVSVAARVPHKVQRSSPSTLPRNAGYSGDRIIALRAREIGGRGAAQPIRGAWRSSVLSGRRTPYATLVVSCDGCPSGDVLGRRIGGGCSVRPRTGRRGQEIHGCTWRAILLTSVRKTEGGR
jgi:hypothetical protein